MTTKPSRTWIQAGGAPLAPLAEGVRRALEDMETVQMTPSTNRSVVLDAEGMPICLIDWMPSHLVRLQTIAAGETPEPEPEKGDTVIRPISPEEAEAFLERGGYQVPSFTTQPEIPPLNLPTWEGNDRAPDTPPARRDGRLILALLVLLALAALYIAAQALGLTIERIPS